MKKKKIRTIRLKKNETIYVVALADGQHVLASNGCSTIGDEKLKIYAKRRIMIK